MVAPPTAGAAAARYRRAPKQPAEGWDVMGIVVLLIAIVVAVAITSLLVRVGSSSSTSSPAPSSRPATPSGPPARGPDVGARLPNRILVPPRYFPDLLNSAGFPVTEHNLFVVQEQIGIMFTTKAWQAMEQFGTERDWNKFLATAAYPTTNAAMHRWPQQVLDGIVGWRPDFGPYIDDLPERYAGILLESVGKGDGGLFGGPPETPLTSATPWKMKGLKQPQARPLLAPS